MTREELRLQEAREHLIDWRRWGPYLSERAWGTVREDYSPFGEAWDAFPHDHARSRAYRWNEDRLSGLTGSEGNHGEDVKEYYYYLDSTPTHSYLRMLYKYPQRPFPYAEL